LLTRGHGVDNSKNLATVDPLAVMLEARSVALVGASPRPGSLGARMIEEVAKSPSHPRGYLVNPRYDEIGGVWCYPGFAELPEPVDLALLAVPDAALEGQVRAAAAAGARSAVIFGSAVDSCDTGPEPGLRERIAAIARDAEMAVCGAGCMGFVNVARGLRAIGYTEPDPLPAGPVALITHSGSVFSALLRTRRAFGFTLGVSSGQELLTPAAAYARYALTLPETKVLALVLEAIRDAPLLRTVLADAAARDLPVLLLTAGTSAASRSLVAAHSGALAAGDGAWQALASAYGVHRVGDLAELADTLELFCLTKRPDRSESREIATGDGQPDQAGDDRSSRLAPGTRGIATVHDSGFERAHVADMAASLGVPFAPLGEATKRRLEAVLDPGLEPGNPLDVWGTGRDPEALFAEALSVLADDPGVGAVALAVDLVREYDGDDSYRTALLAAAAKTGKPLAVLASIPAAIDQEAATKLRAVGIPVLESTRTGLLALRHLLARAQASAPRDGCGSGPPITGSLPQPSDEFRQAAVSAPDESRRKRWTARLAEGSLDGAGLFALLRDYGIPAVRARSACTAESALAASEAIGYPVALKTDMPDIPHKADVGGVHLGIATPAAVTVAYQDLADRLGPRVTITEMAPSGPELILGMSHDHALGPLVVVGAGGILAEYLSDRVVALPPLSESAAAAIINGQRFAQLLTGFRGRQATDLAAVAAAVAAFSTLVTELAGQLAAFDINPLICTPAGLIAVDALAVPLPVTPPQRTASGPGTSAPRPW
jgi:acetate---CoA ligase (ADP-forming)